MTTSNDSGEGLNTLQVLATFSDVPIMVAQDVQITKGGIQGDIATPHPVEGETVLPGSVTVLLREHRETQAENDDLDKGGTTSLHLNP